MAKGIKKQLHKARENVTKEISWAANSDSLWARGMAGEGYAGGYRDALDDVLLSLNGVGPTSQTRYWPREDDEN